MEALLLKRFSLIAITLLSILGYGFFVFAAAPTGGYVPGQTNNPNCAPNDTDCLVQTGWNLNTASHYVTNTTDKIGIGTATPAYKLEVNGDFGAQMTHTSGDISGFNLSNDLFGLGVQGVGMTTIASSTKIFLNGILDFGTGNGSTLYYFDTANGESASVSATDFNGTTPLVLGQSLSGTNEASFFSVESDQGFIIAGPHDNSTQTPNTGAYAFRVLDRDINASGVQTWLSVMNDGQVSIPNLNTCTSIQTDSNGLMSCGSGGSSPITVVNSSSLFSTGLTGTGSGSVAMDSVFLGQYAGSGATGASLSNFIGNQAGYNATNATNSNFFGMNAGYAASDALYSNFFGLSAGYQATSATHSNFFGMQAGQSATNASQSNFFGPSAGYNASSASNSNFFGPGAGYNAANAYYSNFLGTNAGNSATGAYRSNFFGGESGNSASNAFESNFLGYYSGYGATNANNSVFLGSYAGRNAPNANDSFFVGQNAGYGATNASRSIFIGQNSGLNDTVDNTGSTVNSSILIGKDTLTGGFSNSIAIGSGAVNTAANQFMIGSGGSPINDLVITGSGFTTCSVNTGTGAGISCSSDQRLKKNVTDLGPNVLDSITKLKTVTFNWISGTDHDTHIGFLAQDIQQYYPELVSNAPNGYLQVNYAGITPVLVEAIRELNIKISDIQKVADGVDPTFLTNLKTWLGSVTNGIGKITANQLCVHDANGETCLDRDQVNQIQSTINGGGGIIIPTVPNPAPTPTPSGSSSTSSDPVPSSGGGTTTDPAPVPDVVPDSVPPVPAPDPVPPTPDPIPEPDPTPTPSPIPDTPQNP